MSCTRCPRYCGADRSRGEIGMCGAASGIKIAKTMLHLWEEPLLGEKSGAIFFSDCPLKCVYCQNKPISKDGVGETHDTRALAETILSLQAQGAENIDLVSPTQYSWDVLEALDMVKADLRIPVIWNTGGYETPEVIRACAPFVDIFLTDFKYGTSALAQAYSDVPDYPEVAARALSLMYQILGDPVVRDGKMTRGIILRHLVLPGSRKDSVAALDTVAKTIPPSGVILSLMRQYTPDFAPREIRPLTRRVTSFEYETVRDCALSLGFDGYAQDAESASAAYTPDF